MASLLPFFSDRLPYAPGMRRSIIIAKLQR